MPPELTKPIEVKEIEITKTGIIRINFSRGVKLNLLAEDNKNTKRSLQDKDSTYSEQEKKLLEQAVSVEYVPGYNSEASAENMASVSVTKATSLQIELEIQFSNKMAVSTDE